MPAPKGNQFWKLRSKHGRDKIFKTPEIMWEAACEYFQWCEDNPLLKYEQKKGTVNIKADETTDNKQIKDAINGLVEIPIRRPFLIQGLCMYLNADTEFFTNFERRQKEAFEKDNSNENAKGFIRVCKHIRETIDNNKLEGGLSQEYNPTIVARICGLVDKQESKHDVSDELKSLLSPFKVKKAE